MVLKHVCEWGGGWHFFVVDPKKEKSEYFKMNRSTKRFVFLKELFNSFLHTRIFPAWCFSQRTYVAQGHTDVSLLVEYFFSFCIGLCWGHCCMLDFHLLPSS